jgi:hypothetical protein
MDFIDTKTAWTIIHLFGVALGAGGAFVSDGMFFTSIKDKTLSVTELKFLKLGGRFVWVGLSLLIISGLGLFLTNPEGYLASSKFIAKMSIVGVITLNGIYFHLSHIPFLELRKEMHFRTIPELAHKRIFLLISGVISVISWVFSIVLGSLRSIPYSVFEILSVYLILIICGVISSYFLRERILPTT